MEESQEYKGYEITLIQEDYPESPREDENLGTMACQHGRYSLGDGGMDLLYADLTEHPLWSDCYEDAGDDRYVDPHDYNALTKMAERFGFTVLPLYLYDHSGLTIRTAPFSCPWDSGQVGCIFCSQAKIREWFGLPERKRVTPAMKKRVKDILDGEVETYDTFLRGDVWGFVIYDKFGDEADSCWGFYGQESCEEEAKAAVENHISSNPLQLEMAFSPVPPSKREVDHVK